MNKVDLTLLKASPKKRISMLINHLADINQGGEGFLNEDEFNALATSFRSDREIHIYNTGRKLFDDFTSFMQVLAQFKLVLTASLERASAQAISVYYLNTIEETSNKLLNYIENKSQKKEALNFLRESLDNQLVESCQKDKGTFLLKKELPESILDDYRKEVERDQEKLKACIHVGKEFIKKSSIKMSKYRDYIKKTEKWANNHASERLFCFMKHSPKKGVKNILTDDKYFIAKKFKEVEIKNEDCEYIKQYLPEGKF